MNPEFYLILDADELTDELANAVYEAGFDDSSSRCAEVRRRSGFAIGQANSQQVVREALQQAQEGRTVTFRTSKWRAKSSLRSPILVPVILRLVRPFDRHAEVVGLLLA